MGALLDVGVTSVPELQGYIELIYSPRGLVLCLDGETLAKEMLSSCSIWEAFSEYLQK